MKDALPEPPAKNGNDDASSDDSSMSCQLVASFSRSSNLSVIRAGTGFVTAKADRLESALLNKEKFEQSVPGFATF